MNIFYVPNIAQTLTLSEEESLHCAKVLRLAEGTEVLITDGAGRYYRSVIALSHAKRTSVQILETLSPPKGWDFRLHVAMAPTKNMDRTEWFVEKAVEIGIDEITFLKSRYSERKDIKIERIEKIAVSAMKQSQKAFLPKINPMVDLQSFIRLEHRGVCGMAHCYGEFERRPLRELCSQAERSYTILIGPEGDFSEEEVERALLQNFCSISLGESRLRTETAALVACMTTHLMGCV